MSCLSGTTVGTFPRRNQAHCMYKFMDNCRYPGPSYKRQRCSLICNSSNKSGQRTSETEPDKTLTEKIFGLGNPLGPSSFTVSQEEIAKIDDFEGETSETQSLHSMSTEEWQQKYMQNGTVDLWLEDEFNAGSRLMGGRAVHKGGVYGVGSGEGPSTGEATTHTVKIFNHYQNQHIEIEVPEDRYILWEAEDAGLQLPYACRMGCCTACAVRIKKGEMYQPQSLGISAELKAQGYALMCVGYPRSDLEIETVTEDEVYDLQFGRTFEVAALNPQQDSVERDDFALEIANMDE